MKYKDNNEKKKNFDNYFADLKVNEELNDKLTELVRSGENLINYELWVNEKCILFIEPIYIIKTISKDLTKEGFKKDIAYVIVKKEFEEDKKKDEINRI